ncbi:MAG: hypothetical protein DLM69_05850 [Candidatus Chloroheliales bacterium]|nr:MAG: hypothetical protein DLM69_05850 [Chloroflexota bacterium]
MSLRPNNNPELQLDTLTPALSWKAVAAILLAVISGAALALLVLPLWVPALSASLTSNEPKGFWYMARASAFVAYILIWLSLLMGLLITNKLARLWPGGPVAFDLHQYLSILGLAFGLFHALILLGDAYSNYTIAQLLLPFSASQYRPLWVGLGQLGFYLLLLLTFSFYARRWIGTKGWRLLHFFSFAAFILVLMHGLFSGTDNGESWARLLYWVTGSVALFLTIYRIAFARLKTSNSMRQRLTGKQFALDLGTHRRHRR